MQPNLAFVNNQMEGAILKIIKSVAELPDRTSPEDWPEAMLVTSEELATIIRAHAEETTVDGLTDAAKHVILERMRQKYGEGWSLKHDDEYKEGQLPRAAASYAISAATPGGVPALAPSIFGCQLFPFQNNRNFLWPWDRQHWKPKDPRSDLVRAGALILAEIERLDRAAASNSEG